MAGEALPAVEFAKKPGSLEIAIGGRPFATYVYEDKKIPRPYFAHVRAPGGIHVTRNHPPVEGKDPTDHATFHPGFWMAFGDLSGSDFWRNEARVVHEQFVQEPTGGQGAGQFAVRNAYHSQADRAKVICRETCEYRICVRPAGYLLVWDSTFSSIDNEFAFGDQEEMGLGVRVATPITEKSGGTVRNSAGATGAKKAWGQAAQWCDYSGTVDGRRVGVTLLADPDNFRPSWFHVRDYGLMLANPFGRKTMKQGPESRVAVRPGESLRLRFGILVHAAGEDTKPDPSAAYADFLRVIAGKKGTVPICRNGPKGAAHKWGLSPFSLQDRATSFRGTKTRVPINAASAVRPLVPIEPTQTYREGGMRTIPFQD